MEYKEEHSFYGKDIKHKLKITCDLYLEKINLITCALEGKKYEAK